MNSTIYNLEIIARGAKMPPPSAVKAKSKAKNLFWKKKKKKDSENARCTEYYVCVSRRDALLCKFVPVEMFMYRVIRLNGGIKWREIYGAGDAWQRYTASQLFVTKTLSIPSIDEYTSDLYVITMSTLNVIHARVFGAWKRLFFIFSKSHPCSRRGDRVECATEMFEILTRL